MFFATFDTFDNFYEKFENVFEFLRRFVIVEETRITTHQWLRNSRNSGFYQIDLC